MKTHFFQESARLGLGLLGHVAPETTAAVAARAFLRPTRHARPGWEAEVLSRGTRVTFRYGLQGWSFGAGPTVLVVHGWDGRGSQFGKFVDPLVKSGYRVLMFDGPAHGDSPGERTTLLDFASAVAEIATEVGALHAVVGHSFGGAAAVYATEMGLKSERFVLIASPYSMEDVMDRYCAYFKLPELARREFQKRIERETGLPAGKATIGALSAQLGARALILHDPKDQEVPFLDAAATENAWPDSRLISIQNVGHRRILKNPTAIHETVEFIAE